jgi:6-phosphogluconolactonase
MNRFPIRYYPNSVDTNRRITLVQFILIVSCIFSFTEPLCGQNIDVWVGTAKTGIYHLTLDVDNGKLSEPTLASETSGAGFLAMHPNQPVLYSTNRENEGSVTAFSIINNASDAAPSQRPGKPSKSKRLKQLQSIPTGDGGAACVAVDKLGKVLMSAQYGGGSTSTYRLKSNGDLLARAANIEHGKGSGVNAKRQATAHPHWVGTSPDNRFLLVPDLGTDQVFQYQLNEETGDILLKSKISLPPGSGPRHMKFHPSGQYAFVLNELTLSISVFSYRRATGKFDEIQVIETLPLELKDRHLNSAAEIRVHPNGKFIYSSNRGHDSISVFKFAPQKNKLEFVERESVRGAWPRNFNIDPSGKWLLAAGQHSNTLALFEINQDTGELTYARQIVNVPAPICVLFQNE